MAIPKEILEVKRPKNTVVFAYGKNKDKYGVRERLGCSREEGKKNPIPIEGKTIGHIVGMRFVPKEAADKAAQPISASPYDVKDFANIVFLDGLFKGVLADLGKHYNEADSRKLYCISLLRVAYPGIKDYELKDAYDSSYLSNLYPGVGLSKNAVSAFVYNVGKTYSRVISFMKDRVSGTASDSRLLIDGTLKSNHSKVNTLSEFSRKAKLKGRKDISVLFCFDLTRMEPVCSKCYPGNMIDSTAYESFLEENGITTGLIIGDKAFTEEAAKKHFEGNDSLHHLNPLRRNSKYIGKYKMLEYQGALDSDDSVLYKKAKVEDEGKWLYSFRDSDQAVLEEKDFLKRMKGNEAGYTGEEYKKRRDSFGTIVFECDLDWTPEEIYFAYSQRWTIEVVMRYYKHALDINDTRVHEDLSVYGSEFIDFLACLLTFKALNRFDREKLLSKMTYKQLMRQLEKGKKVGIDGNWEFVKLNPKTVKIYSTLGIIEGQGKKSKEQSAV